MGKVKSYYWDEINGENEPTMTDTKLENEYAEKLGLIMGSYIKGDIDSIEYQIELERLEEWYQGELKNDNS